MSGSMKRVWVNGISGRMGRRVCQSVEESESYRMVGGTNSVDDFKYDDGEFLKTRIEDEDFDVVIDFSTPAGNAQLFDKLTTKELPNGIVVIATTALSEGQEGRWKELSKTNKLRVIIAPNTGIGVNMFIMHAREFSYATGDYFSDIEITEKHHRAKADSPSGTAKRIAEVIQKARPELDSVTIGRKGKRVPNEIGIHSLRGGTIVGEHTISFISEQEEITMTHRAESREIFSQGALVLAEWLATMKHGFYTLDDVFGSRR